MLSRLSRSAGSLLSASSSSSKLVRGCAGGAAPKTQNSNDHTSSDLDGVSKEAALVFAREERYGAHNYHPLPVALSRAEGKFFNICNVF